MSVSNQGICSCVAGAADGLGLSYPIVISVASGSQSSASELCSKTSQSLDHIIPLASCRGGVLGLVHTPEC